MSDITIYPSPLKGVVTPPPSKSITHRAIICAAVSGGDCLINNFRLSDDTKATLNGMRALGSRFEVLSDKLFVKKCVRNVEADIDCMQSGSTMRFLIPLAAALGVTARFTGQGRLPERPLSDYEDILSEKGIIFKSRGGYLPAEVKGKLTGGVFRVSGKVSSQFISGLLMAIPMTGEGGEIVITDELESAPYADMTARVMAIFGVNASKTDKGYYIDASERYSPADYTIEADYSQAAFFLVANALGSDITINGLSSDAMQGDKKIVELIEELNASKDAVIDAKDIPDLVPPLAVLCGLREGTAKIINAGRLRYKESDRLESTYSMMKELDADIKLNADGFTISGVKSYKGCRIDSFSDHRIAMAAAIAATKADGPVKIIGADCVTKSYTNFFDEFERLKGRIRR
ncbi:MAG: 3-phosphoshikimate 1-carboxyvinyltransferase [Christensenellales bacterium]|jgi:3-phosphoshikimate 1-carboxyvinyltransferase